MFTDLECFCGIRLSLRTFCLFFPGKKKNPGQYSSFDFDLVKDKYIAVY